MEISESDAFTDSGEARAVDRRVVSDLWTLDDLSRRVQTATSELAAIAQDLERRRRAVSVAGSAVSEARQRMSHLRKQGPQQLDTKEGGRLAATEESLAREEGRYAELLADYERSLAAAGKSRAKLRAQLERLRAETTRLREAIPADLLRQFDTSASESPTAVSEATERGRCSGCDGDLPPEMALAVRESGRVAVCPRCQRLVCPAQGEEPASERASVSRSSSEAAGRQGRRASGAASTALHL